MLENRGGGGNFGFTSYQTDLLDCSSLSRVSGSSWAYTQQWKTIHYLLHLARLSTSHVLLAEVVNLRNPIHKTIGWFAMQETDNPSMTHPFNTISNLLFNGLPESAGRDFTNI